MTEDGNLQRMTEAEDEYFADALTNMQPHCDELVSRLTDAIRGLAMPRAEEALIPPFDGSYAANNFIQQLERTSEGLQDDATLQARLRTLLKGEPLSLYNELNLASLPYSQAKQTLIDLYPGKSEVTFTKFLTFKLNNQIQLGEYYRQKIAMGLQLGLTNPIIVEALTEGLQANDQRLMRAIAPKTLTEWYAVICCPIRSSMTRRCARHVIMLIWVFSLSIAAPWAVFFTEVDIGEGLVMCGEVWPHPHAETAYFAVANLGLCYVAPLTVIVYCYTAIWWKVWRRRPPGEAIAGTVLVAQRSRLKVVKMLAIVVALFAASWLPLYVIFARIKLGGPIDDRTEAVLLVLLPISQWLGAANSCVNPLLYFCFNQKFRNGFAAILRSRSCCSTLRESSNVSRNSGFKHRYDTQCDYLSTAAPV
ncbi:NPFFR2 [Cordylochernes scorpioides]|uniref:NPFFR2 n=1 Tax=Cordylochernes scorpioides TaxID=51811 RepID=A0ABY6K060_9ARAC|nr:NPFFR2 [Cordylochernes scorpioides]